MDSERLRNLAAMITIVRDHPHQYRLPCMDLDVSIPLTAEFLRKHVRRPPLEAPLHDLPRRLERRGELTPIAGMGQVVFPALSSRTAKSRASGSRSLENGAYP